MSHGSKRERHVGREHQLEEWNVVILRRTTVWPLSLNCNPWEPVATLKRLRVHNRKELLGYCKQIAFANKDMRADFNFVLEKVQNVVGKVREDLDRPNNATA